MKQRRNKPIIAARKDQARQPDVETSYVAADLYVDADTVSWYRMGTGAKRNAFDFVEFLSLAGQSPPSPPLSV